MILSHSAFDIKYQGGSRTHALTSFRPHAHQIIQSTTALCCNILNIIIIALAENIFNAITIFWMADHCEYHYYGHLKYHYQLLEVTIYHYMNLKRRVYCCSTFIFEKYIVPLFVCHYCSVPLVRQVVMPSTLNVPGWVWYSGSLSLTPNFRIMVWDWMRDTSMFWELYSLFFNWLYTVFDLNKWLSFKCVYAVVRTTSLYLPAPVSGRQQLPMCGAEVGGMRRLSHTHASMVKLEFPPHLTINRIIKYSTYEQ